MNIGLIGQGAIARYVMRGIETQGHNLAAVLVRAENVGNNPDLFVSTVQEFPDTIDVVIDCAGHEALAEFGPAVLAGGTDMITVSAGALADQDIADRLEQAARQGKSRLHLVCGAIGALDCLSAAANGKLASVTYVGRKPPSGWKGSPAEDSLDLASLAGAEEHFAGTARQAALRYPKNANVAAAVALAGLGFDDTQVRLIADPTIEQNIHEVEAEGDFGAFRFRICGNALPDNPRSSALTAMSVLAKLDQISKPIALS